LYRLRNSRSPTHNPQVYRALPEPSKGGKPIRQLYRRVTRLYRWCSSLSAFISRLSTSTTRDEGRKFVHTVRRRHSLIDCIKRGTDCAGAAARVKRFVCGYTGRGNGCAEASAASGRAGQSSPNRTPICGAAVGHGLYQVTTLELFPWCHVISPSIPTGNLLRYHPVHMNPYGITLAILGTSRATSNNEISTCSFLACSPRVHPHGHPVKPQSRRLDLPAGTVSSVAVAGPPADLGPRTRGHPRPGGVP